MISPHFQNSVLQVSLFQRFSNSAARLKCRLKFHTFRQCESSRLQGAISAPELTEKLGRVFPALAEHGTNRFSRVGVTNSTTDGGTTADYILARLKRDHPELAEEVITGKRSAHSATRGTSNSALSMAVEKL